MKEDNKAHKEKNDNYYLDYINNLISSPKQTEKEPILNLLSSPEKNSMNQKFFPSKENYFGIKTSPKNLLINIFYYAFISSVPELAPSLS